MNWVQFKDSVSDMCLAGIVVAYWSLTHEAAGFSTFTVMTNIFLSLKSANSVKIVIVSFSPTHGCLSTVKVMMID